ncbi:TerB family tellurite resistance protein [Candidatus Palauibacter sp.]|uniref:tellurite resistance TerB family protein n=1 Tax=Candidatus Palauibacter sp. TaxID=3101350 RepID=UPI003B516987
MTPHPNLREYLHIAYGCIACDRDIDEAELACLRSIAVQLGHAVKEIDSELEFLADTAQTAIDRLVERATNRLIKRGLDQSEGGHLLDILVQLVEADGAVRVDEIRYVRNLMDKLRVDRDALRNEHPQWRDYLAPGLRDRGAPDSGRAYSILSIRTLEGSDDG